MDGEIAVALIGLAGSAVGSLVGIVINTRLTTYRLEQLEKKVDKHNQVIERTYKLEGEVQELQHDIRDLKNGH